MICKKCKKEFYSIFSNACPFCGCDNSVSFGDAIDSVFSPLPEKKKEQKKSYDPFDWEDPDNCSDIEYEDDEDYDDFDNF